MIQHRDGWWSPQGHHGSYIRRALELLPMLRHVRATGVAVQAGGHIGIVPKFLAERFERVYTFEPELVNFACLVRNCEDTPNIWAARGALGNQRGCMTLQMHSKCTGGHRVHGAGSTPVYRIDDLNLDSCDAILLDIEGFEMEALEGAAETIEKRRPTLIIEENKKLESRGREHGDIARFTEPWGYELVDAVGEDLVFVAGAQ